MVEVYDWGPAFPGGWDKDEGIPYYAGMSLRDWFAGQVLPVLEGTPDERASMSYLIADAMLKRRLR